MTKDGPAIVAQLRELMPELRARFGVDRLSVFGSYARGEATPDSDVDILVAFCASARPTLFSLAEMDARIEQTLGLKVDTVPEDGLNPRLAPYVRSHLLPV